MKQYLKLIRIKHWLKNILIFLPLFFSMNISNTDYLITCSLAFIVFCFASSIVYVLNDMNDIEKDRKHPEKKKRPLASGAISISQAKIVILVLAIISGIIMYFFYKESKNLFVIAVPLVYITLNILYSKGLKDIPIVDVVILVSGFVLRVMYGGVVTNITVSKYLYLMIMFGAFYLGFGKRRNEIIKNGDKGRKVLALYNKDFLDKNMYVALSLAVVSYTLWCVDPTTVARIGNDYLFWTVPILIVLLQLYSLNIEGNSHGDPIEVILSDKKILATGFLYVVILILIIYVI